MKSVRFQCSHSAELFLAIGINADLFFLYPRFYSCSTRGFLRTVARSFCAAARDRETDPILLIHSGFVAAPNRAAQGSSLMSVWSTSTGRNTVCGAESGGAVLPSSHLPIHVHVAHEHLRNADGHCFHKPFHDHCQVGRLAPGDPPLRRGRAPFLFVRTAYPYASAHQTHPPLYLPRSDSCHLVSLSVITSLVSIISSLISNISFIYR